MFDSIAPRYDLVNRIMSFGLDVRWRKAAMKRLSVAGGGTVVDLHPISLAGVRGKGSGPEMPG